MAGHTETAALPGGESGSSPEGGIYADKTLWETSGEQSCGGNQIDP
jgi:hypothetical protein